MEILVLNNYFIMENVGIAKDFINMYYLNNTLLNGEYIFLNKEYLIKDIGELEYYFRKWTLAETKKTNPGDWWYKINVFDKEYDKTRLDWNKFTRYFSLMDFELKIYIANNYYNKNSILYNDNLDWITKNLEIKNDEFYNNYNKLSIFEINKDIKISKKKTILVNLWEILIKLTKDSYNDILITYKFIDYNLNNYIIPNYKKIKEGMETVYDYTRWMYFEWLDKMEPNINNIKKIYKNIYNNISEIYNNILGIYNNIIEIYSNIKEKIKPFYIKNILPTEVIVKNYINIVVNWIKIPIKIWAYWLKEWKDHFIIGFKVIWIKNEILLIDILNYIKTMKLKIINWNHVLIKSDNWLNKKIYINVKYIIKIYILENIEIITNNYIYIIIKELSKNNINTELYTIKKYILNKNIVIQMIDVLNNRILRWYFNWYIKYQPYIEKEIKIIIKDLLNYTTFISEKRNWNSNIVFENISKSKDYLYTIFNNSNLNELKSNDLTKKIGKINKINNLDPYLQYIFFEKKIIKTKNEQIYFDIIENTYDDFWKKIQPILYRSNIETNNLYIRVDNNARNLKLDIDMFKKNISKNVYNIDEKFYLLLNDELTNWSKFLKNFLILNEEKKEWTLFEILFKNNKIKYFIVWKTNIKINMYIFIIMIYNYILLQILNKILKKNKVHIRKISVNILKAIYLFLFIIVKGFQKIYNKDYLFSLTRKKEIYYAKYKIPKFYEENWSYFDYINSWELEKKFKSYKYYENYKKNIWRNEVNINELYIHILMLLKSILIWIKINYHFFIKNYNNFMFHNMLFYYWNKVWSHEMLIMYTPISSHIVKGLEIFDYLWYFLRTNWFIYKIKNYYFILIGKKFARKKNKKMKKIRVYGIDTVLNLFTELLLYIDHMYSHIKGSYYGLKSETTVDKLLSLGRINTEIPYFHILYFSIRKEFYFRIEYLLSSFLKKNLLVFLENKEIFKNQKPIIILDYSLLNFIFEMNKDINFKINNNNKIFINKIYYLLLNNYFSYLFFFSYVSKKFMIVEIYIKFFTYYIFSILKFIYVSLIHKSSKEIILNYVKNVIIIILDFILYIKYSILFIKEYINLLFIMKLINIIKKNIYKIIICILILYILNLNVIDILMLSNSLIINSIINNIIYIAIVLIECIEYVIEYFLIKIPLNIVSLVMFKLFSDGSIFYDLKLNLDYNILFSCWTRVITSYYFGFEIYYEELTFNSWSKWIEFYVPTNPIHASFRAIFIYLFQNIQDIWFLFLKIWTFYKYNIYASPYLIMYYSTLKSYYIYWTYKDILSLNFFINIWKSYYYLNFIINWLINIIVQYIIKFKDIINIVFYKIEYVLNKIYIYIYIYILSLYYILYYIYIYNYIYIIVNNIELVLYNLFITQIFFNINIFIYNIFIYYSESYYYTLNLDNLIKFTVLSPLGSMAEFTSKPSFFGNLGYNILNNVWWHNAWDRDIIISSVSAEWKNLNYFKSFYTFGTEINKSFFIFYFICSLISYKIITFLLSLLNNWYWSLFYNNYANLFFAPYINWKNFEFFKKERSFYFSEREGSVLDTNLIYLYKSYSEWDKYFFQKYNILLYKDQKYKLYKGKLRKLEVYGNQRYIKNTLKTKTKKYISNNNIYPIKNYDKIIKSLINKKKKNYLNFYVSSVYFFKNYQIFWYGMLDDFLWKTIDRHGSHSYYQFRKMYNWPDSLKVDNYNKIITPIDVRDPLFNDMGEDFLYSYDFIGGRDWLKPLNKSFEINEKKKILSTKVKYKLKLKLKDSNKFNEKGLKDYLINVLIKKPNKNLYFYNYLNYPFIFFLLNSNLLKENEWNSINYIFPLTLPKNKNIYNTYFLLYRSLINKYTNRSFGDIFFVESHRMPYLKWIFYSTAIENSYLFDNSNFRGSWKYENNPEKIILNHFYSLKDCTKTEGWLEPRALYYILKENLDKFNEMHYSYFNWLHNVSYKYLFNLVNMYKISTLNYKKVFTEVHHLDESILDEFLNLKAEIRNNGEYISKINEFIYGQELKFNDYINTKIDNLYTKFNSWEMKETLITRYATKNEFHYNQNNFAVLFLILGYPLQFFIDEWEKSWDVEDFYIYIPGLIVNDWFKHYEALLAVGAETYEYEFYSWEHIVLGNLKAYVYKFMNFYGLSDHQTDFTIEYLSQPGVTENIFMDEEMDLKPKRTESRNSDDVVFDEDYLEDEFCLPFEDIKYVHIFKDLVNYKPKFYKENNYFYLIKYNFLNYTNIYNEILIKYLNVETSLVNEFLSNNFNENSNNSNLYLNWLEFSLNKNYVFINKMVNSNFEYFFYKQKKMEEIKYIFRFFFEKNWKILNIIKLTTGNIYREYWQYFKNDWENELGKELEKELEKESISYLINYNYISMLDSKWDEAKKLYAVSGTNPVFKYYLPVFDQEYLNIILSDKNNFLYKYLSSYSLEYFYFNFKIIFKNILIFNENWINDKIIYFDYSKYFGNNTITDLWYFQLWLNQKEAYLSLVDYDKDSSYIHILFNIFAYFLLFILLFSVIFIFKFFLSDKYKYIILKKKKKKN